MAWSRGWALSLLVLASALAARASSVTVLSSASSTAPVAPSSIAEAFGSDLATTTQLTSLASWPVSLGGTTVSITDSAGVTHVAGINFVSPLQVNFQIPPETATGAATVTIASADGTRSTGTVQIAAVAPGLYSANANGKGAAAAIVLSVAADASQSTSLSFACGVTPLSCVTTPI